MTVAELVKELLKQPQDARVQVTGLYGAWADIDAVNAVPYTATCEYGHEHSLVTVNLVTALCTG